MKIETHICDILTCNESASYVSHDIQVVFTTEQTEGRTTKPYLYMAKLDLCQDHFNDIIDKKRMIQASGAQGHNKYWI